ncbi:hypothetical protein HA466_0030940 [Hirschfeldia incana]|nr:hypothetical protein HA466_0030940 [Hirschfeldia incana]
MDCNLIPLIYINPMVHVFSIPFHLFSPLLIICVSFFPSQISIIFSLSFFFLCKLHFFTFFPICIIISILFLQYQLSDFYLTAIHLASYFEPTPMEDLQKRLKYICSNPSPMWLCGFEITILVYSMATVSFRITVFVSSALLFCWKSVSSVAPPASPDLLLCSSSRNDASDSFRVVSSLPPVESCLLLACDGQRTRSKTTLDGSRERTGLEVGFFH